MAIYHLSIQIITRGEGKSSVAAAAYRAAETIKNEYDGIIHDYTSKKGIVHTEILLPGHAPAEYQDRAVLWNAVEKTEKQCNSQLAREIEISLPVELTEEQNISLARRYVQEQFVNAGMCADVCLHDKDDGNPHMHIMLTIRPINDDGTWGAKIKKINKKPVYTTDWNDRERAEEWRKAWADYCNAELRANGFDITIDHRSYERQGVEQIPTVHMGAAATQMEKRGIRTERGDMNRIVEVKNTELRQLRARIKHLNNWIYKQPIQDVPTIGEMMNAVNSAQNMKSRWKKLADLKTRAKVLIFIQHNGIDSVERLAEVITDLNERYHELSNIIKSEERRITTLNAHLAQVEIHKQHSAVYKKHKQLDPKKRSAYADKHAEEITAYEAAAKYLKDHLNGYGKIPANEWQTEREKLLAERYAHVEEYYKLKDDVKSTEVLRRGAETLMRETPERTQQKSRDMEL